MSNPIAVPHDGSPASDRTLPVAAAFARSLGAPLHFIRLCELRAVGIGAIAGEGGGAVLPAHFLGQSSTEAVGREMDLLVSRAERECGVAATGDVGETTDVAATLLARLERLDPPLVVMATRGEHGLARALLGSVADAVVRESHLPVALVAPGSPSDAAAPFALRRVLVALDGAPEGEEMAARTAALVRGASAALELVSVVQPKLVSGLPAPPALRDPAEASAERGERERYLEGVAAGLRERGHDVRTRVMDDADPVRAILAAAHEAGADLIAMATHGRSGLRRLARGSVADGVVRGATIPVLLHHPAGWMVPAGVPSPSP